MIPMQRITRWPLLVDAVLKRLSPQDSEYISCQYALATLNKVNIDLLLLLLIYLLYYLQILDRHAMQRSSTPNGT